MNKADWITYALGLLGMLLLFFGRREGDSQ